MKKVILLLLLVFSSISFSMPRDLFPFVSPEKEQRFSSITKKVRCLICQNETIADSSAPIANDLREKIYHMIKDGKTDAEIKQYLVDRYGDFVLFLPRFNARTLVLWSAPILFLLIGFSLLIVRIRRANREEIKP